MGEEMRECRMTIDECRYSIFFIKIADRNGCSKLQVIKETSERLQ